VNNHASKPPLPDGRGSVPARRLLFVVLLASAGCTLHSSLPELGDVPAFKLTTENGAAFSSDSLKGKVWVADFIFTTCNGPCPRMSAQMRRLQVALKKKPETLNSVRLLSITVDPKHDDPPTLLEYAARFRADSRIWSFLTGPEEEIRKLSVDTFHVNTAANGLEHSTRFILVDGKARVRGYYESNDATALDQLAEDIDKLRKEVF
jgi:protein SCO1/2